MKTALKNYTEVLSLLLIYAFGMSLLSEYGWFFDLHSHFAIQYAIGAVVLGSVFLFYKKWIYVGVLFVVAGLNIYEIRNSYSDPWTMSPPHTQAPNLTIVQFNKLFGNHDYDSIKTWLKAHHQDIDVMFVQEVGVHSLYQIKAFKEYFPHQYPQRHQQMFNDVKVLSRIPVIVEKIPSFNKDSQTPGTKVIFQREDMAHPVHLYSIHTQVPLGKMNKRENSEDLLIMQEAIKADPHPYKIFSGDWNMTPYAPTFQSLLRETGMKYNDYTWFPKTTWHSIFHFPFLKIPIDHMIYSPAIKQISKEVGPSLGSDHHVLIGRFYVGA